MDPIRLKGSIIWKEYWTMKQAVTAASAATILFWIFCSAAFAVDATSQTEVRWNNGVREAISRTIDPAAPFTETPMAAHGTRSPLDATGSELWNTSDAMGMMNNVAMSDNGSVVAIAIDLNNSRLQVYDGDGGLTYEVPAEEGGWGSVAVPGAGDYVVYGTGNSVYLLPPNQNTPFWVANPGPDLAVVRVAVSRDGQRILAMEGVTQQNQDSVHVWAFAPGSSNVLWRHSYENTPLGGFMGANFSADGSHLVLTGRNHIYVLNPTTGVVIWDTPAYNTEHAAAVSGNGQVISYGSNNDGKIRVFHWNSAQQTYILLWSYTFTGGTSNWGTATAISANGETVAGGSLQFTASGNDAYLAVFNTYGNGTPLWTPVSMADLVGDVAISDDGITIAACSWGPLNAGPADVQVFDKYSGTPFYTYNHPGSPNDLVLTPDGTHLFAGGKLVHNRQFGMGGSASYFGLDLEGGTVTGTVTLQGTGDYSGVTVEIENSVRHTLTNAAGLYQLAHIPAGTHTVTAHRLGYTIGQTPNIVVTNGSMTPNVNYALDTSDVAPTNLTATTNIADHIQLTWSPVTLTGRRDHEHTMRLATGDEPFVDPRGPIALNSPAAQRDDSNPFPHDRFGSLDDLDEADSIHVWRSALSGGPYALVAALLGNATSYSDNVFGLRPGMSYYYVITAVYANAESEYSNEATGMLDDDYLNWSPTAPPMTNPVTFDGVLSPNEWADAVQVDISDVLGYDGQDPPGTAFMYMKYDDATDRLLIAAEDHANTSVDSAEGLGFYVDDDNSDTWTTSNPGSEGNYWAYWFPTGATLRYRSLSGGVWGGSPYVFPNPELGFSAAAGYLTMEVALPLGFHNGYDIALYGPTRTPGIGAFIIQRNGPNPIFHGYWPQDIPSIVSNPEFFSATTIDAQLYVPPAPPSDVAVLREGSSLHVTWSDPTVGIDNLPLSNLDGINVYRNGVFMDVVPPGTESWLDDTPEFGGWYEYALGGFIPEDTMSFEGPWSDPVGIFAGAQPQLMDLSYDDGEWDVFQIPAYPYDGNREAVRFDLPEWADRVYSVQIYCNTPGLAGLGVAADDGGLPGDQLAGPFWFMTPTVLEYVTLHFPGTEAPVIDGGSCWVTMDWQANDVWNPGLGADQDEPHSGASYYFTNSTGWMASPLQNFMIRAGVGDTPNGISPTAPGVVHQFRLLDNYPNPFNPETMIPFELAADGDATLRVYNLLGQEVATLISGPQVAGYHVVQWNGKDDAGFSVTSGVYLVRLEAQDKLATRRIALIR